MTLSRYSVAIKKSLIPSRPTLAVGRVLLGLLDDGIELLGLLEDDAELLGVLEDGTELLGLPDDGAELLGIVLLGFEELGLSIFPVQMLPGSSGTMSLAPSVEAAIPDHPPTNDKV